MVSRWGRLAALVVMVAAAAILSGCSGTASEAFKGNSNDGWGMALGVTILIILLLFWFPRGRTDGAAEGAALAAAGHRQPGEAHGDHVGHGAHEGGHVEDAAACVPPVRPEPVPGPEPEPVPYAFAAPAPVPAGDEPARTMEAPEQAGHPDDLKIVEGIGPKICGLLYADGIISFAQLAQADLSHLRKILADANLSHLADPTTWPQQAKLANDGDWAALKVLQDSLKGGRRA